MKRKSAWTKKRGPGRPRKSKAGRPKKNIKTIIIEVIVKEK